MQKDITKYIFIFAAVALIPLVILGYYTYGSLSSDIEESAVISLRDEATQIRAVRATLAGIEGDLIFLAKTPPISGIMRARSGGGVDSQGGSTYQQWTNRLASIFTEMALEGDKYTQIRYLDEKGNEMVRVDFDGNTARRLSKAELSNKSDRFYFTETMKLLPNTIYVSPLDLNREGTPSEIEIPHKPTLRYALSVTDSRNNVKGMIVINVLASKFLDPIQAEYDGKDTKVLLVDQDGFYLSHPQADRTFGGVADLNTGHNLKKDYPNLSRRALTGQAGALITDDTIIAHVALLPDLNNTDKFWSYVIEAPKTTVLAPVIALQRNFVILAILVLVLFFLFIYSIKAVTRQE